MSTFGERLRSIRRERGINQSDLASALGVSERGLQNYETGEREPKLGFIRDCADFFGVSTDYLLGRSDVNDVDDISDHTDNDDDVKNMAAEREFLKWVDENLEGSFFYDFAKSPEDAKKHMMETLRLVWERERRRKPGQKQGD